MKTTKNIFYSAIALGIIITIYTGCKGKEEKTPKDYSAASDNAAADNAFAGIWKQIGKVANDSSSIRSGYPTVTISPFNATTWPKDVTIDFGPTNILGSDLVNRRGVISAHFTGPYSDSGTVITITLTNFYHNNYHVQGTQTITNKGHVASGHLVYNVVVNNASVTNPSGGTSTWSTNQDREWFAGEATPLTVFDDVYLIRGSANGVSVAGDAYTIAINTDLRVNVGCPWIVSGSFTLTLINYPNYPIGFDYGSGTCDPNAVATLNGVSYNIVMQ